MSTMLSVITYNCHLFGESPLPTWHDKDRQDAIIDYLYKDPNPQYDIVAIQEVWYDHYVKHFRDNLSTRYPSHFDNPKKQGISPLSNPSGLILFSSSRVVMDMNSAVYLDMIHKVGAEFFDLKQDAPTGKGYFKVNAVVDGTQTITIITTHMPTGASSHTYALDKCFQLLAEACSESNPVVLLGDFNIDTSKIDPDTKNSFYDEWIGPNGYLGKAGMTDWFQTNLAQQPSNYQKYSVDGATNTCWRHFNEDNVAKGKIDELRIDYLMTSSQMSVAAADISVCGPNLSYDASTNTWSPLPGALWYWNDHGNSRDCSDHFPLAATITF